MYCGIYNKVNLMSHGQLIAQVVPDGDMLLRWPQPLPIDQLGVKSAS